MLKFEKQKIRTPKLLGIWLTHYEERTLEEIWALRFCFWWVCLVVRINRSPKAAEKARYEEMQKLLRKRR